MWTVENAYRILMLKRQMVKDSKNLVEGIMSGRSGF